jgi:hypothetical protein
MHGIIEIINSGAIHDFVGANNYLHPQNQEVLDQ